MASTSTARQDQAASENAFDQLAPSFASTSTSGSNKLSYDVFINHRGCDVKHKLASTIYHTLDLLRLRAFLDVEELELGDVITLQIQEVMTSASRHIAIFSPNYAQSPWCLAELSFMLKTGTKIIPIFYNVQPDDLRWVAQGKGIYAPAFSEHEKKGRYTPEKLEDWKRALHLVSYNDGYLVNANVDEGELLKTIVNRILGVMKRVPLEVAKHPVGLDELVQHFETAALESVQSQQNVKIVGIVGMGGSGKTTLAKELFNRKSSSFNASSFVFQVRDAASKNALPDKQKKLLADLGFKHLSIDNVDEGKGILANRLSSLRVLIILDDVDHIDQIDALLPHTTNLGSESLVVVTSRELDVLASWGVSCNFKMPRLNPSHAEQLFCWHAFLRPSPLDGFEVLVEKFLTACKGLPLSLKVFGGQLYRKKSEYWESQLNKISKILPADIKQTLQVSYNALDDEEREIFLDVACFFIGEQKSRAIAVWDGSGWSGLHGLETLVNKCLVELDEDNCIGMHDHLRDMGREIAATHSPYRFWHPEQIHTMKKYSQGSMLIRGITATGSLQNCLEQFVRNSRKGLKRLRFSLGLQILHVHSNQLTEEIASILEDLVCLRWVFCEQLRNLPSWLSLRNLRVLELVHTHKMKELWEDKVDPPLELRELTIGSSNIQKFPSSIGRLKQLKKINIHGAGHCSSLPKEFSRLKSLQHLELHNFKMLSSLPEDFGDLINLKHIDLTFSEQLQGFPESFSQLIQLEYLVLSYCKKVFSLPVGLGNLKNLRHIDLSHCSELRMLPDSFEQLIHLEYLVLSFCEMLTSLPAGLGALRKLRHIDLSHCSDLRMLPDSFKHLTDLEYLNLQNCIRLKFRSDMMENMRKIQYLNLQDCWEMKELPRQITNQGTLKELRLFSCVDLTTDSGQVCTLETLLTSFPSCLGNLSSLSTLYIGSNMCGTSFPATLAQLSSLTTLNIFGSDKLEDLPDYVRRFPVRLPPTTQASKASTSEECFPNLQNLRLWGNSQLMEIGTLPTSLSLLEIRHCKMLKHIRGIGGLVNLNKLLIWSCPELDELPSFADLASLKIFEIKDCPKVEKIEGLECCRSLEELRAETCWKVPVLQSLEKVEKFIYVVLTCDTISAIKPCIQSMKECPGMIKIRGKVVRFVKPIVKSFDFPDLLVVRLEESSQLHNFRRNYLNADWLEGPFLWYAEETEESESSAVITESVGKVVHIHVSRVTFWSSFETFFELTCKLKAMFVTGDEGRIAKAFYQLLALLE